MIFSKELGCPRALFSYAKKAAHKISKSSFVKIRQKQKNYFQKQKKYVTIEVYDLLQKISAVLSEIKTQTPFDLAKHSTIGIGGKAKLAFYPKTIEEVCLVVSTLQTFEADYCIVGNMSNILPPDNPKDKIIVCLKELVGAQIGESGFALAGTNSGTLLRACRYARRSGVEFLAGIPCTLGGALYMNAGVNGKYIADVVQSVTILRDGQIKKLSIEECDYSYKHSVFMQNKDVILGAELRLKEESERCISETEKEYLKRRSHLPKGKSMGCVFKNLNGFSAGKLIEEAGLKGIRHGNVYIAEEHANFIINGGKACEKDVRELIEKIKEIVYIKFGVMLEEEIRYLT